MNFDRPEFRPNSSAYPFFVYFPSRSIETTEVIASFSSRAGFWANLIYKLSINPSPRDETNFSTANALIDG